MKKIYLLLVVLIGVVFITGCGSESSKDKSKRTVEDLLDMYVEAYVNADAKLVQEIFPPFYIEYAKDMLTTEKLEQNLKSAKEEYGDDFNITYEVTNNTKCTDEELETVNKAMATYYKAKENASECYRIEGSITFKGSKRVDPDPLSMAYCNYDGSWYLVGA